MSRFFIALLASFLLLDFAAAQALSPVEIDRLTVNILRDVHNRGAELYNTGNPGGCYRIYEGALATTRAYLPHHPDLQKLIDNGLDEAAMSTDGPKVQAFKLHEVIENVRRDLKKSIAKAEVSTAETPKPIAPMPKIVEAPKPKVEVAKPIETPKPVEAPKPKPIETPKPAEAPKVKPIETPKPVETPKPKPIETPKPAEAPKVKPIETPKPAEAPKVKEPKKVDPTAELPKATPFSGLITLDGQPIEKGAITLVSLKVPTPRVYGAVVKEGKFTFSQTIPEGLYVVAITSEKVPSKYQSTGTTPLRIDVAAGSPPVNFDLKSK